MPGEAGPWSALGTWRLPAPLPRGEQCHIGGGIIRTIGIAGKTDVSATRLPWRAWHNLVCLPDSSSQNRARTGARVTHGSSVTLEMTAWGAKATDVWLLPSWPLCTSLSQGVRAGGDAAGALAHSCTLSSWVWVSLLGSSDPLLKGRGAACTSWGSGFGPAESHCPSSTPGRLPPHAAPRGAGSLGFLRAGADAAKSWHMPAQEAGCRSSASSPSQPAWHRGPEG